MYKLIEASLLIVGIGFLVVTSFAQQVPNTSLLFEPGIAGGNLRLDDNPVNDLSFLSLTPALGMSVRILNRVHTYTAFQYINLSGTLLEPYEGAVATVGARYYISVFDSTLQTDNYTLKVLKKRFSFFIDARYGKTLYEKMPENNRYKSIGNDWSAGVGVQFYFTPWLSISRMFSVGRLGPFYGDGKGLVRTQYLSFHKRLTYWPENQSLWNLLKDKRSQKGKRTFEVGKGSSQLEFGYGYAPDRVLDENNGAVLFREKPRFYRVGVRYALMERLDVGGSLQLIDANGSLPELSDRRDQYYALIASSQYSILPLQGRFKPVVKAHLKYTNYTYFNDSGHAKQGHLYAGFAPSLRFFVDDKVLVTAAMNFFLTTDNDRNTLANNYPELSLALLRGGG